MSDNIGKEREQLEHVYIDVIDGDYVDDVIALQGEDAKLQASQPVSNDDAQMFVLCGRFPEEN